MQVCLEHKSIVLWYFLSFRGPNPSKVIQQLLLWDQTNSSTSLTRSRLIWQRKACSLPWKKQPSFLDHPTGVGCGSREEREWSRHVWKREMRWGTQEGKQRKTEPQPWVIPFCEKGCFCLCVCMCKSVFLPILFFVNVLFISYTTKEYYIY